MTSFGAFMYLKYVRHLDAPPLKHPFITRFYFIYHLFYCMIKTNLLLREDNNLNYFYPDIVHMRNNLANISQNTSNISAEMQQVSNSLYHINASISTLNETVEAGVVKLETEFGQISSQLNDVMNIMKFYNDQQFIQNEERNQLLAEIDKSLKAPNKTEALEKFEFGIELAKRGKYDQSINYIKEAIELNPIHYLSYIHVALGNLQLNQFSEALEYAKEALSHASYYNNNELISYTYYITARVYEKMGDFHNALIQINHAVNANPSALNEYEQARMNALNGHIDNALATLENAIVKDPIFFSYALVDEVFQPCKEDLEQLLTFLKNKALEDVQMHWRNIELTSFPYIDLQDKYHSEFTYKQFVSGIESERFEINDWRYEPYYFNYNSFLKVFRNAYQECMNIHNDYVRTIRNALHNMSYVELSKAADLGHRFRKEIFNPKCDNLYGYAQSMIAKCENIKYSIDLTVDNHRFYYESKQPKTFFERWRIKNNERDRDELLKFKNLYERTMKAAEKAYRDLEAVTEICRLYVTEKSL